MAERLSEARVSETVMLLNMRSIASDQREHGGKCGPELADLLERWANQISALRVERDEARAERDSYKESLAALVEVTEADHLDRIALEEERDEARQQRDAAELHYRVSRLGNDAIATQLAALQGACEQLKAEWRGMTALAHREGPIPHDETGHTARWTAVEMCANDLERLLSAPPVPSEEPTRRTRPAFGATEDGEGWV